MTGIRPFSVPAGPAGKLKNLLIREGCRLTGGAADDNAARALLEMKIEKIATMPQNRANHRHAWG